MQAHNQRSQKNWSASSPSCSPRLIMKKLLKICGAIAMLAFVFLGVYACSGDPYSKVNISITSSHAMTGNTINIDFTNTQSRRITINARVTGLPKEALRDAFVKIESPEIIQLVSEPDTRQNNTEFVFEVKGSGSSNLFFCAEGSKIEKKITVNVGVAVTSIKVVNSYNPIIPKGRQFSFDDSQIIYNNSDSPQTIDASQNNKGVNISRIGAAIPGVTFLGNNISVAANASVTSINILVTSRSNPQATTSLIIPIVDPIALSQNDLANITLSSAVLSEVNLLKSQNFSNGKFGKSLKEEDFSFGAAYGRITMFSNTDRLADQEASLVVERRYDNSSREIVFELQNFELIGDTVGGLTLEQGKNKLYDIESMSESLIVGSQYSKRTTISIASNGNVGQRRFIIYAYIRGNEKHTKVPYAIIDVETLARPAGTTIFVGGIEMDPSREQIVGGTLQMVHAAAEVLTGAQTAITLVPQPNNSAPLSQQNFDYILVFQGDTARNLYQFLIITNLLPNGEIDPKAPDIIENGSIIRIRVNSAFALSLTRDVEAHLLDNFNISMYACENYGAQFYTYMRSLVSLTVVPMVGIEDITFISGIDAGHEQEINDNNELVVHATIDVARSSNHEISFIATPEETTKDSFVISYVNYAMRSTLSFDVMPDGIIWSVLITAHRLGRVELEFYCPSLSREVRIIIDVISLPKASEEIILQSDDIPYYSYSEMSLEVGRQLRANAIAVVGGSVSPLTTFTPVDGEIFYNSQIITHMIIGNEIVFTALKSGSTIITLTVLDQAGNPHVITSTLRVYKNVYANNVTATKVGVGYVQNDIIFGVNNNALDDERDQTKATQYGVVVDGFDENDILENSISFGYEIIRGENLIAPISRSAYYAVGEPLFVTILPLFNLGSDSEVVIDFIIRRNGTTIIEATRRLVITITPKKLAQTVTLNKDLFYFTDINLAKQTAVAHVDAAATDKSVRYLSSNPGVASVDEFTGVITAHTPGETLLIAYSSDANAKTTARIVYANGTQMRPYLVTNLAEFKGLAAAAAGKVFKMETDIDLFGEVWVPFNFAGSLEGMGHVINNLTLNHTITNSGETVGLFKTIGGYIRDVSITHGLVTIKNPSGFNYSFGVVAGSIGDTTTTNKININSLYNISSPGTNTTSILANKHCLISPSLSAWPLVNIKEYFISTRLNGEEIYAQSGKVELVASGIKIYAGTNAIPVYDESTLGTPQPVLDGVVFVYNKPTANIKEILDIVFLDELNVPITSVEVLARIKSSSSAISIFGDILQIADGFNDEVELTITNVALSKKILVHFFKNTFEAEMSRERVEMVKFSQDGRYSVEPTQLQQPFGRTKIFSETILGKTYYEEAVFAFAFGREVEVFSRPVTIKTFNAVNKITLSVVDVAGVQGANLPGEGNIIDMGQSITVKVFLDSTIVGDEPVPLPVYSNVAIELIKIDGDGYYHFLITPREIGVHTVAFQSAYVMEQNKEVSFSFRVFDSARTRIDVYMINDVVAGYEDYLVKKHMSATTTIYPIMNTSGYSKPTPNNLVVEVMPAGDAPVESVKVVHTSVYEMRGTERVDITGTIQTPNFTKAENIKHGLDKTPYYLIEAKVNHVHNNTVALQPGHIFVFTVEALVAGVPVLQKFEYIVDYPLTIDARFAGTNNQYGLVQLGDDFEIDISSVANYSKLENVEYHFSSKGSVTPSQGSTKNRLLKFNLNVGQPERFDITVYATEKNATGFVTISNTVTLTVEPVFFKLNGIYLADENPDAQTAYYKGMSGQEVVYSPSYRPHFQIRVDYELPKNQTMLKLAQEQIENLEYVLNADIANILKFRTQGDVVSKSIFSPDNVHFAAQLYQYGGKPDQVRIEFNIINTVIYFELARTGIDFVNRTWVYSSESNSEASKYITPDYYLKFVIKQGTNENNPLPIATAEALRGYLHINGTAANDTNVDLILVADIQIDANWLDGIQTIEANFKRLDGNGYVINLQNGAFNKIGASIPQMQVPEQSSTAGQGTGSEVRSFTADRPLNVGLFTSVGENTILENLTLGIEEKADHKGGEFTFAIHEAIEGDTAVVNFGVLTGHNKGVITNAKIVPVIKKDGRLLPATDAGRSSKERTNINILPILLGANVQMSAGAIAGVNSGFITNCSLQTDFRVGGTLDGTSALVNDLNSQGVIDGSSGEFLVGGIAGINNNKISSSSVGGTSGIENRDYISSAAGINLVNGSSSPLARTGGVVAFNYGDINYCYIEGAASEGGSPYQDGPLRRTGTHLKSDSASGGFVFENSGYIGNSFSNIKLEGNSTGVGFAVYNRTAPKDIKAMGVVKEKDRQALIEFCYSLCDLANYSNIDSGARPFYGGEVLEADETGKIENCTFLQFYAVASNHPVNIVETPGLNIMDFNSFQNQAKFNGFAFSESQNVNSMAEVADGAIWAMVNIGNGLTLPHLVAADSTIKSHRELTKSLEVKNEDGTTTYGYRYDDDCRPGSKLNPIIISTTSDFLKIRETQGENKVINADNKLEQANNQYYRFVRDIIFPRGETIESMNVTMTGQIDGNAMLISNIYINGGEDPKNTNGTIGLFGRIMTARDDKGNLLQQRAVVRGLRLGIAEFFGAQITFAGGLAGTVTDANIFDIEVKKETTMLNDAGETVAKTEPAIVIGKNIVGGVLGLVEGSSRVYNIKSDIDVISTYNRKATQDVIFQTPTVATRFADVYESGSAKNEYEIMSYAGGAIGAYNVDAGEREYSSNSVHVVGSRVEGGFVGGVVGYIGAGSNVVDYRYQATEMSLLDGRVGAGGVVGENRGQAVFFVSEYVEAVQKIIDEVPLNNGIGKFGGMDEKCGNQNIFGSSKMEAIGGIAGFNMAGSITHSYSKLPINNSNSSDIGGIVGITYAGRLEYLYATGSVALNPNGNGKAGGIVGNVKAAFGEEFPRELTGSLSLGNCYALNGYNKIARGEDFGDSAIEGMRGRRGGIFGELGTRAEGKPDEGGSIIQAMLNITGDNYYNDSIGINDISGWKTGLPYDDTGKQPVNARFHSLSFIPAGAGTLTAMEIILSAGSSDALSPYYKKQELLSAFYSGVQPNWQSYEDALANRDRFPKIVNYENPYENVYDIHNEIEFDYHTTHNKTATLVLRDDIIINEADEINIGEFAGTIFGNGKTITINKENALFSHLRNVVMIDVSFNVTLKPLAGQTNFGGVALTAQGTQFVDCKIDYTLDTSELNKVSANSNASAIGGFVGISNGGLSFTNCTVKNFNVNIYSNTDVNIGGMVGTGASDRFEGGKVENVNINVNATGKKYESNSDKTTNIGSLAGSLATPVITGVEAAGTIMADGAAVSMGGLVGLISDFTMTSTTSISNSHSDVLVKTPALSSARFYAAGAIVGSAQGYEINSCEATKVPQVYGGEGFVGLIAGIMAGGTNLSANLTESDGSPSAISGGRYVGGVAGWQTGGVLDFSFATIDVKGYIAGGLVGILTNNAQIKRSFSSNNIEGTVVAGGLIGQAGGDINIRSYGANGVGGYIIDTCYSASSVRTTNTSSIAAGLVGMRSGGKIKESYFAGRLLSNNGTGSALIYGGTQMAGTLTNVFALEEIASGFNEYGEAASKITAIEVGLRSYEDMTKLNITNVSSVWLKNQSVSPYSSHLPFINRPGSAPTDLFMNVQKTNPRICASNISNLSELSSKSPAQLKGLFILTADVTTPIAPIAEFGGVLIGGGHTVAASGASVFTKLSEAVISGLEIKNYNLAYQATNSLVTNVITSGKTAKLTANDFGGIVSKMTGGVIMSSFSELNIDADGKANVGGLIGISESANVAKSFFSGEIYSVVGAADAIIGVGNGSIKNSYATGSIFGAISPMTVSTLAPDDVTLSNSYSISYMQARSLVLPTQDKDAKQATPTNFSRTVDGERVWTKDGYFPRLINSNARFIAAQSYGTRVNPILLDNRTRLTAIDDSTKAYVLTAHITLDSNNQSNRYLPRANHNMIPTFTGTLYGANLNGSRPVINNLTVTTRTAKTGSDNANAGLIGVVDGGLVSGIAFVGANIIAGQVENAGVVAGSSINRGVVSNCKVIESKIFAAAKSSGALPTVSSAIVGRNSGGVLKDNQEAVGTEIANIIESVNAVPVVTGSVYNPANWVTVTSTTPANPRLISTADELLRYFHNDNAGQHFKLGANIAFPSDYRWEGITTFSGTFDGDGYKITGLQGSALVATNQGTIKNLYMQKSVVSGDMLTGLIASTNAGIITNCFAYGYIGGNWGSGSIVGTNSGTINNCHGAIYTLGTPVGGKGFGEVGLNIGAGKVEYPAI